MQYLQIIPIQYLRKAIAITYNYILCGMFGDIVPNKVPPRKVAAENCVSRGEGEGVRERKFN